MAGTAERDEGALYRARSKLLRPANRASSIILSSTG
jgi:hypothetical protein